jgi:hypothetical protein
MPINHAVLRIAAAGGLAGLAIFLVQRSTAAAQIGALAAALSRLHPSTMVTALLLSGVAALCSGVTWWRLLGLLGHRVHYRAALCTYLSAGIAGYLVNSVGPVIGTSLSLRRHGVSPARAALLTMLANALGFCGILVWTPVGVLLLARIGIDPSVPIVNRLGLGAVVAALAVMATVMVLAIHALTVSARSGRRLLGRWLKLRPASSGDPDLLLRSKDVLALVPWNAASWLSGVVALYVVLAALAPQAGLNPVMVIGAAALSATLGSLAVVVPEGVGVSEGVLAAVLVHATALPLADCLAASVAMRGMDLLTKAGLLGALSLGNNTAISRRLAALGVAAGALPRYAAYVVPALWSRLAVLRRSALNPRAGWLPIPALSIGLALAMRLPHVQTVHVIAMSL